jgi:hypothetical protein
MDRGRYAEAVEAFEKSQALTPSASTLLNLGNAYARQGDDARALQTFERALGAAGQASSEAQRQALTTAAQSQIEALRPRVASLVVHPPQTAGVQVQLNGQTLQAGAPPLHLNPGLYRLEATAPGKLAYSETLRLSAGQSLERSIPPLVDPPPVVPPAVAPPAVAAPAVAPPAPPAPDLTRAETHGIEPTAADTAAPARFGALPWVLTGAGAGLVGVSLITGLSAKSKADALEESCPTLRNCDPRLHDEYDSAKSLGIATDVLWIAGAASAAAGATLLIIVASDGEPDELLAGCSFGGCTLQGRF